MALMPDTERERLALCEWLKANGVDPNAVPIDSDLAITVGADGARVIRYTEFVRDAETGNILANPKDHSAMRQPATALCTVEPPAWLNVPGG